MPLAPTWPPSWLDALPEAERLALFAARDRATLERWGSTFVSSIREAPPVDLGRRRPEREA